MLKPKVIVLEGLPGAGKSTILRMLEKDYHCVSELSNSDQLVDTSESDYMSYDLAKIKSARNSGKLAFVDRGYPSTLAWNHALMVVNGESEYYSLLSRLEVAKREGHVSPDLYVYLTISPELSLSRKLRKASQADIWTQKKYLEVTAKYYPAYFYAIEPDVPLVTIDGTLAIEEIIKIIIGAVT